MNKSEAMAVGRLLSWTAVLATLAVTPWASYDPINVPKLAVITIGGFMALGALVVNRKSFLDPKYRLIQIFGLAFILDLILFLFVSGTNTAQEFYGTFGRATGLVAYASLCLLLMTAVVAASGSIIARFIWILLGTGGFSIAYGVIQALGGDPIKWVNQYSPVIGFLGNPNFQSSFVGLSGVLAVSMLLAGSVKLITRSGYITYLLLVLYVIKETHSQQGFLVFVGGTAVVVLIWISKSKFKVLTISSVIAGAIGFVLVTLGSLNSGPLAGLLYKESVTYRGDYWRAGWKMTVQHPFFGVGLDSYGDWYRRARNVAATVRRGPDITSNSAHNVVIDFSANGGFPLAAIYLFMMALVIVASVRLIKRSKSYDPVVTGLIALWIAYKAQSIISLNQLGLAVWGWIISGLIIGHEINSRSEEVDDPAKVFRNKGKSADDSILSKIAPKTLVGMFIGLLVGLLVGLPPLVASSKFKSALDSANAQTIQDSANIWPYDQDRAFRVAAVLANNNLNAEALKVLVQNVKRFPDHYYSWSLISTLKDVPEPQRAEAFAQMKRLDPLNPNLK
jgi:O-antigen ligase